MASNTGKNEAGYVDFISEDTPVIVPEIEGRLVTLLELEHPRRVIGYRVYDPGCVPPHLLDDSVLAPQAQETAPNATHALDFDSVRALIDKFEFWKDHGPDHYNVSADHLAREIVALIEEGGV